MVVTHSQLPPPPPVPPPIQPTPNPKGRRDRTLNNTIHETEIADAIESLITILRTHSEAAVVVMEKTEISFMINSETGGE